MHARLIAEGNLPQALAVAVDLEDLPQAVLVGHGEHQPAGAVMQLDIGDESGRGWLIERRQLSIRPHRREHGDLVFPTEGVGHGVELPRALLRQADVFPQPFAVALAAAGIAQRHAFDQQQPLEVQQRVGQQGLALEGHDPLGLFQRRCIAPFDPLADLRQAPLECVQSAEEFCTIGILFRKGIGEVVDRPADGFEVDSIEPVERLPRRRIGRLCVYTGDDQRSGKKAAGDG